MSDTNDALDTPVVEPDLTVGEHVAVVRNQDGEVVAEVQPGEGYVMQDGEYLSELRPL